MERDDFSGVECITDTLAHTGRFGALQAVSSAVLDTGTVALDYTGNSLVNVTIPAGTTIYGTFTTVKLASGKVLAYSI